MCSLSLRKYFRTAVGWLPACFERRQPKENILYVGTWSYTFACMQWGVAHLHGCALGVFRVMKLQGSHHLSPAATPLLPLLPAWRPAFSLCYPNTVTLTLGCMPVQRGIFTVYFATSRKNKGCFVGALFHSLHQLFLSGSHLSQLMTPPVPSHRKWGIRMTRGGYEKGICFTAVGDKITGGSPGDRKRMKKRESAWGNEIWVGEKNS